MGDKKKKEDKELAAALELARQQQLLDNPNIVDPFGSVTNEIDPITGRTTRTSGMSPELQAAFTRATGIAAEAPPQQAAYQMPGGFDKLQEAVGQRVGERYGGPGNGKPQQQRAPEPKFTSNY